jgi:hypothetical protein
MSENLIKTVGIVENKKIGPGTKIVNSIDPVYEYNGAKVKPKRSAIDQREGFNLSVL